MGQPAFECSFGAAILQKHLTALRSEVDGVRLAEDIEPIHRMRVASRRLRAALPLFAECFNRNELKGWIKQLQHLTSALGAARDADVQVELVQQIEVENPSPRLRPGLRRLHLRLAQQRSHLQQDVGRVLTRLENKQFFNKFDARLADFLTEQAAEVPFPHQLYQQCAAAIIERLDAFLAYETAVHHPEDSAQLHAMRIAAKKLRYTMETFVQLYPDAMQPFLQVVKTCQELLGDLHDCDVWISQLPEFIQSERERTLAYYGHVSPMNLLLPGLRFFEENRIQVRASRYAEFLEKWLVWKSDNLWGQFKAMLTAPLIGAFYPPLAAFPQPQTGPA